MKHEVPPPGSNAALPPEAAIFNFRDFGGFSTLSGARLQAGRLYRSGQLESAGGALSGILARLGVTGVIDLRADTERKAPGGPAYAGFSGEVHSATVRDETIPHAIAALMTMTHRDEVITHMCGIYRHLADSPRFVQSMGQLVRAIARQGVTLVHCFAGKDRTGLAAALLLLALDVHRDDVMEDYLKTNAMGPERIAHGLTVLLAGRKVQAPDWILQEAMSVRPDYLEAGLAEVLARHEGPAAYLSQAAGLGVDDWSRIASGLMA